MNRTENALQGLQALQDLKKRSLAGECLELSSMTTVTVAKFWGWQVGYIRRLSQYWLFDSGTQATWPGEVALPQASACGVFAGHL